MSFEDKISQNKNEEQGSNKRKPSTNPNVRTLGKSGSNNVLGTSSDRRSSEIKKALDEALKLEDKGSNYKLTLLERGRDINVNASAICLSTLVDGCTYFFTMIVQDSDFKIVEPSHQSIMGHRSERRFKDRPAQASDLWAHSAVYADEVTSKLMQVLKVTDLNSMVSVGAYCIAPEFDIEQEASLNSILTTATQAIDFQLSTDQQSSIVGLEGKLSAKVVFKPTPIATTNGHPVRRDWCVQIGVSSNSQRNNSDIASSSWSQICEVSGDVRLEYIGKQGSFNQFVVGQPIEKTHDVYIDIKKIDFSSDADAAIALMALANTCKLMVEGRNYLNCLANRFNELNALHLDIDENFLKSQANGRIFDATDKGFNIALVDNLLFNDPSINLVCPEAGDNSWLFDHLAKAIEEPNGNSADLLISASNTLLYGNPQGQFSNRSDRNGTIEKRVDDFNVGWIENEQFVIEGYYPHRDNDVLEDISTWDYLAVLNEFGENDEEIVNKFACTYSPGVDVHERMHERIKVLTDIEAGFVHTGTSYVIGLDPTSWIDLANRMCNELGNNFTYDNGNNLDMNNRVRGQERSTRTFSQSDFQSGYRGRGRTNEGAGRRNNSRIL